jgi:hypothetical protein
MNKVICLVLLVTVLLHPAFGKGGGRGGGGGGKGGKGGGKSKSLGGKGGKTLKKAALFGAGVYVGAQVYTVQRTLKRISHI